MTPITLSLGLLALLSLVTTLGFAALAWKSLQSAGTQERPLSDADAPFLSVLKPLKGVTPELYDNLAAFARQDYPRFELVLGTTDPDDPAVAIAERLQHDFPQIPIRIVARRPRAAAARGFNPKVINLAQLESAARHELILVSDADVRPHPGYLRSLVAAARPNDGDPRLVGLVTNGLIPAGEESLGAALETLHQAGFVTPSLTAAFAAGHPCVVGKSMLMTKTALRAAGGWDAVREVLAEDYVLGRRIARAGYRVRLSLVPLTTWEPHRSLRSVFARHLRWAQMRARIAPVAYLGELLLLPTPLVLVWAVAAAADGFPVASAVAASSVLALRTLTDGLVIRRLRRTPMATRRLLLCPVKDLLLFAAWILGACRRTIDWRGTRLIIGRGSVLHPAVETSPPALEPSTHPLSQPGRAA